MSHEQLFNRIRAEYLEMPGMRLTIQQVQRLCGVERTLCQAVLHALVEAKFLCVKPNGTYVRMTEGDVPRPAKAREGDKRMVAAS
jgi:DNA-binding GntR family transcriptional regulator